MIWLMSTFYFFFFFFFIFFFFGGGEASCSVFHRDVMSTRLSGYDGKIVFSIPYGRHAYRPEKIGTVLKICDKIKSVLPFCLILSRSEFQRSLQSFKTKSQYAICK